MYSVLLSSVVQHTLFINTYKNETTVVGCKKPINNAHASRISSIVYLRQNDVGRPEEVVLICVAAVPVIHNE